MKNIASVVSIVLSVILLITGCSNTKTKNINIELINDCITSYFSYYKNGDFENMKQYCTEDFVQEYFHVNDVFGNACAELINIESIEYVQEKQQYKAITYVKCIPTSNSSLYDNNNPGEATFTYNSYFLSINNGNIKIVAITTE